MGRIASIDYGLKRLGMAISDPTHTIATPLPTVLAERATERTLEKVLAQLAPYALDAIILGFPLHLDGNRSFLSDEVEHFITKLQQRVGCPILKWDERLSTVQAERSLMEGNFTRKKRASKIDQVVAVLLLQNYLDAKSLQRLSEQ